MKIPLIKQLFAEKNIELSERALDSNWFYDEHIRTSIGGFNPLLSTVFYNQKSNFSKWLKKKNQSARILNFEDTLVSEVFFAAHDYLHNWAYGAIHNLMPELNFGYAEITPENFEDFVYLHLLSETVATTGVDYWYLCNIDLNRKISIGTRKESLTTRYHKKHLPEFKRFNPKFNPENVDFFSTLDDLYAYAKVDGFTGTALERSPIIIEWMKHEYKYGETQRSLTRHWLRSLSSEKFKIDLSQATSPLIRKKGWRIELRNEIGRLLWKKVVENKAISFPPLPRLDLWGPKANDRIIDYRFFNINSFGDDFWELIENSYYKSDSELILFSQIVSKYLLEEIDPADLELIMTHKTNLNINLLRNILRNYKPIPLHKSETSNLFLAG